MKRVEQLLYPGTPLHDKGDFLLHRYRFTPDTTTSNTDIPEEWKHDKLLEYLLAHTAIQSISAEIVGQADSYDDFGQELAFSKRDATIHLPGTDYAIPDWAHHFGSTIRQIVNHEHSVNPRADLQIAQMRFRRHEGLTRNTLPHIDGVPDSVRNFHFYLVPSDLPAVTFDGEFTYEPHPTDSIDANPLEFYRDIDEQFASQISKSGVARRLSKPYDITVLSYRTVHLPPAEIPHGRTLLAVQFYELAT
ncbi:MAG: hypothetical protein ACSLEY_04300 [Candidatus Saccharimonadales bacterium]